MHTGIMLMPKAEAKTFVVLYGHTGFMRKPSLRDTREPLLYYILYSTYLHLTGVS